MARRPDYDSGDDFTSRPSWDPRAVPSHHDDDDYFDPPPSWKRESSLVPSLVAHSSPSTLVCSWQPWRRKSVDRLLHLVNRLIRRNSNDQDRTVYLESQVGDVKPI